MVSVSCWPSTSASFICRAAPFRGLGMGCKTEAYASYRFTSPSVSWPGCNGTYFGSANLLPFEDVLVLFDDLALDFLDCVFAIIDCVRWVCYCSMGQKGNRSKFILYVCIRY